MTAVCLIVGCASPGSRLSWRSPTRPAKSATLADAKRLEQAGQWSDARAVYTDLVQQQPQNAELLHRLAVVCTRLEDHAAAATYYNRALELNPQDAELLTDAGYGCYLRGEYPAAEELLQLALQVSPQHVRASNNLGLVLGMQGRIDEAYVIFEQVQPREAALQNLSFVYQQRGEWDEALDCYRLAQQANPGLQIPKQLLAHASPTEADPAEPTPVEITSTNQPPELPQFSPPRLDDATNVATIPDDGSQPFSQPEIVQTSQPDAWIASELGQEFALPTVTEDQPFMGNDTVADTAEPADEVVMPVQHQQKTATPSSVKQAHSQAAEQTVEVTPEWPVVTPGWPAHSEPVSQPVPRVSPTTVLLIDAPQKPGTETEDEADYFLEDDDETAATPSTAMPTTAVEEMEEEATYPVQEFAPAAMTEAEEPTFEEPIAVSEETAETIPAEGPSTEALPSLRGYCLVALKDQRQLRKSHAEFELIWEDARYQFSSQEAAERFTQNPERYLPVAGGIDVVAVRRGSRVVDGSLDHAAWFRDQLFLFASDVHLQQFRAEPQQFVDP